MGPQSKAQATGERFCQYLTETCGCSTVPWHVFEFSFNWLQCEFEFCFSVIHVGNRCIHNLSSSNKDGAEVIYKHL